VPCHQLGGRLGDRGRGGVACPSGHGVPRVNSTVAILSHHWTVLSMSGPIYLGKGCIPG
jgi:hypothetical protein